MGLNKMEQQFINAKSPAEILMGQYQYVLKNISIMLPIFSALFAVIGIVLICIYIKSFWWIGLIFVGMGLFTLCLCFIARAYIKNKILALDEVMKNRQ